MAESSHRSPNNDVDTWVSIIFLGGVLSLPFLAWGGMKLVGPVKTLACIIGGGGGLAAGLGMIAVGVMAVACLVWMCKWVYDKRTSQNIFDAPRGKYPASIPEHKLDAQSPPARNQLEKNHSSRAGLSSDITIQIPSPDASASASSCASPSGFGRRKRSSKLRTSGSSPALLDMHSRQGTLSTANNTPRSPLSAESKDSPNATSASAKASPALPIIFEAGLDECLTTSEPREREQYASLRDRLNPVSDPCQNAASKKPTRGCWSCLCFWAADDDSSPLARTDHSEGLKTILTNSGKRRLV